MLSPLYSLHNILRVNIEVDLFVMQEGDYQHICYKRYEEQKGKMTNKEMQDCLDWANWLMSTQGR